MILTALFVFVGGTAWTVTYSFTKSGLLPKLKWVGFAQYDRLWNTKKWLVAIANLAINNNISFSNFEQFIEIFVYLCSYLYRENEVYND